MSNITNVEFKARCFDPDKILAQLKDLGADFKGIDHQIDTYFPCPNGRLKLRQGNIENTLIFYDRQNHSGQKESQIDLTRLGSENSVGNVLSKAYGVKIVIDKKRNISFIDNVKFHVDQVERLGSFVEVEVIDEGSNLDPKELHEKCSHYAQLLNIRKSDYLDCSYSDLLLEMNKDFESYFEARALEFLNQIEERCQQANLDLARLELDHLCFRCSSHEEYDFFRGKLKEIGEKIHASIIGGREISLFKLNKAISFQGRSISIIELPAPKEGSSYVSGFEHAEFVIVQNFESFSKEYPLEWDWSGAKKDHNPELRYRFHANCSVKFHHQSLESIIQLEKN
ncbi:MAG: VOC family protein [Halobacteriovoraceae bacterium]|nr:VOC family protein [Halobacteriovoraceae bacterium]